MCRIMEEIMQESRMEGRMEGRREGRIQGRMEGRLECLLHNVKKLLDSGMTFDDIATILKLTDDDCRYLRNNLGQN